MTEQAHAGFRSRLYTGAVTHTRLRPRHYRLRHSCFWFVFDLDETSTLAKAFRWFSVDRFNLLSLNTRDHGDGSNTPLREQVETHLRNAGIALDGGHIELLCMPRVLGYGFNPISVYFCHRRTGDLAALLYQVHNTFGERHSYLIPVADGADPHDIRQDCDKGFYVSPFMDMDMHYDFRVRPPRDSVLVAIRSGDAAGPMLHAALAGKAVELTDGALLRVSLSHPLLTLKVIAAIHAHALVIWLKGVKLRRRPPPPHELVTMKQTATRAKAA